MADKTLSDKERAFLQAARRELDAKSNRREVVDTSVIAGTAGHRGSAAPAPPRRPAPAASRRAAPATSPLDAQTVLGWDHPAARKPVSADDDKWSRIAALMEAERAEANAKRAKARRRMIIFLIGVLIVVLIVGARSLVR